MVQPSLTRRHAAFTRFRALERAAKFKTPLRGGMGSLDDISE
jgi:hypothetical protein